MSCASKRKNIKKWKILKTKWRWNMLYKERQQYKKNKRENSYERLI